MKLKVTQKLSKKIHGIKKTKSKTGPYRFCCWMRRTGRDRLDAGQSSSSLNLRFRRCTSSAPYCCPSCRASFSLLWNFKHLNFFLIIIFFQNFLKIIFLWFFKIPVLTFLMNFRKQNLPIGLHLSDQGKPSPRQPFQVARNVCPEHYRLLLLQPSLAVPYRQGRSFYFTKT